MSISSICGIDSWLSLRHLKENNKSEKWLTAKDELGDITNATNEIEFSVGNVANKANEVKIETDKTKQSTEDLKGLVAKFNM